MNVPLDNAERYFRKQHASVGNRQETLMDRISYAIAWDVPQASLTSLLVEARDRIRELEKTHART